MSTFTKSNCTIVCVEAFEEEEGQDSITCEPLFVLKETELTVRASLEKDTVEGTFGVLPGRDLTEHYYTGKLAVPPSQRPSWLVSGGTFEIRFDDGFIANCYIYFSSLGRLGLDEFFGQPIEVLLSY